MDKAKFIEEVRLTEEEIRKARLLTSTEIVNATDEAIKFSKDNTDVPEAYRLKFTEVAGAISGKKIAEAQLQKILNHPDIAIVDRENIKNERCTFPFDDKELVDEAVLYGATVHLEMLDDSCYMLIMSNERHYWHFRIFSEGKRSHIKAQLYESEPIIQ